MYQGGYPPQYQAPDPKKGIGCLGTLGILFGLGVVVFGGFCVLVAARKTDPKEEKAFAEAKADAEAKEAERVAKLESDLRKECKLKPDAPVFIGYGEDIRNRCERMIEQNLKVPGSGDFPSASDHPVNLVSDDGCRRIWTSYVDAKNAFGVKVRTRYECTFDPRTGLYSTKVLN